MGMGTLSPESAESSAESTWKRPSAGQPADGPCEVTMRDAAKILNSERSPEPLAETHAQGQPPRPYSPRFTMPSGSRPLEGYTIKRGIGVGGFGEVYYATSDAGKDVALKKIQRNLDIELRGVRQCLNLKHHNLLSLYDIRYDEEGQAWVVMEYVAGDNLQQWIERHPQGMPLDQLHAWWDGITSGVAHLHDCGIVHRDLKPGNIFLDGTTVKIGDYGLSKFISCSRRSGQTQSVGTFHYMAPEIGQGCYGKEIDIYALGIILFEMLTGRVPFDGESSQEIIMKHLTALPPVSGLASPYREMVERALAKAPESRFGSVAEMRGYLAGSPVLRASAATAPAAPPPFAASQAAAGPAPMASLTPTPSAGPASAPESAVDSPLADEPVARAVRAAYAEVRRSWQTMSTPWRMGLLGVGLFLVFQNSRWLVPYVGLIAIYYVTYLGIRVMVLHRKRAAAAAAPAMVAAAFPVAARQEVARHETRRRKDERTSLAREHKLIRTTLNARPLGQQLTERFGAFLLSAAITAALTLVASLFIMNTQNAHTDEIIPNFVWLTITSTLATWAVISVARPAGDSSDHGLRWFVMLVAGFVIGGVAFGITKILQFEPIQVLQLDGIEPNRLHAADGTPFATAYLLYFGLLFGLLPWWKQTDPLRRHRLSLFSTAVLVALAIILQGFCPIPQGFLVAATCSLAVQLASPWINPEARRQFHSPISVT